MAVAPFPTWFRDRNRRRKKVERRLDEQVDTGVAVYDEKSKGRDVLRTRTTAGCWFRRYMVCTMVRKSICTLVQSYPFLLSVYLGMVARFRLSTTIIGKILDDFENVSKFSNWHDLL